MRFSESIRQPPRNSCRYSADFYHLESDRENQKGLKMRLVSLFHNSTSTFDCIASTMPWLTVHKSVPYYLVSL